MNSRILLVDDDYDILSGYQRNLRKHFQITVASSGEDALEIIASGEQFAVILTDFKMPGINGIELLAASKLYLPDTVRMLITGYAELQTAIEAVNQGSVFRFLTKPVAVNNLLKTLNDAVEQYKLITSEKELLNKTLKGSVKLLIDILGAVNPIAFSKASRIRILAKNLAFKLGITNTWEVEVSALLSQTGCVVIPTETLEKFSKGEPLDSDEEKMIINYPEIGKRIIQNIPRLEDIAEIIAQQNLDYKTTINKEGVSTAPPISRILKVLNDYDNYISNKVAPTDAIKKMFYNSYKYDPEILNLLTQEVSSFSKKGSIKSIPFKSLRISMELADDIKDDKGHVLLARGYEITDIILMRLINSSRVRTIVEPILVYYPD